MSLQNRVDPKGNIITTTARGSWLGNRGVIHNEQKRIVRPYKIKAWITCMLEFRGRHREIMRSNRWTELFFLDEATAFSAGHRPCFQCRYADHQRFKKFWLEGNPEYEFDEKTPVAKIDDILQSERVATDKSKVTYMESPENLPDGTFIQINDEAYLLKKGKMYLWSPMGYGKAIDLPKEQVKVLTPKSIVNTFRAGYKPQIGVISKSGFDF